MRFKHYYIFVALAVLVIGCRPEQPPDPPKQTEWLERSAQFQDQYELEQLVVLSRHNIRTPLVGKGSVLERVTDSTYVWFNWQDPASYLTAKGQRLENKMGIFFHEWLTKKGFTARYASDTASFRFYANAKQRCQLTARAFADAVLPGKNPTVEMHAEFDKMDPVFNPQITKLPAGFAEKAQQEIAARMGDLDAGIATQYALIERVINISHSPAYPDTASFAQFPSSVGFKLNAEPYMNGGLKMACTVSDALSLQYYEEPDLLKAAFGHQLTFEDWTQIAHVKEWYGDALFTAPSVAVNVAHPLLLTMLAELQQPKRVFTFLCGHDSNVGSVLAALGVAPYDLPETIERTTPIGCKLAIEKFVAKDGTQYADLWLIYASANQLRSESNLSYSRPPVAVRLQLDGLTPNADRLYRLQDLEQRFNEAINAY